ncbi:MAG: CTP synthase [Candidatus Nanohaloarchaea archaeon]
MSDAPKWVFVTGGVLSGLGKGLVSASVSKLLQTRGLDPVTLKCDGYLNVDPGTMNPHEHGEVFVLDDGTEVDMDFGHYERFLDINGKGSWNLTSGKVFSEVIDKERRGDYLGKTVQMVPHVTNEIIKKWRDAAKEEDADAVMIELGGTVGDLENRLYLESVRQLISELPDDSTFLIHTTLVPYLDTTGEQKTKPTQHSVKMLRETGLEPDMIVGRSQERLTDGSVEKISLFCNVEKDSVISDPDLDDIYRIPLLFDQQNVDAIIADKLGLPEKKHDLDDWREKVDNLASEPVSKVAICGKYTDMDDSYVSVEEALRHAAAEIGGSIEIDQIDTEEIDTSELGRYDGVIIPGGFGSRGIEGKIDAINYCRENNVPTLGLCYGLQLMVVEFARNVLGIDAASQEFAEGDEELVVSEMPEQKDVNEKGGTMRLGAYTAEIKGQVAEIYGSDEATERHRHRFEVDPSYHDRLEENGLMISGKTKNGTLAEYIELPDKEFFIGTQAHPEFTSSLQDPNPLYRAFVESTAD